jgi:hypothetical protein
VRARLLRSFIFSLLAVAAMMALRTIFDLEARRFELAFAWIFAVPGIALFVFELSYRGITRTTVLVGHAVASFILGCLALMPLGQLFDMFGWPYLHTWALAHGTFDVAVPALVILTFILLCVPVRYLRERINVGD